MNTPMFAIVKLKKCYYILKKEKIPIGETGSRLLYHIGKASGP